MAETERDSNNPFRQAVVDEAVKEFLDLLAARERLREPRRFPSRLPRLDEPVNSEHWRRLHSYASPALTRLGGPHSRRFRSALLRSMASEPGNLAPVVRSHVAELEPRFVKLGHALPKNLYVISLDSGRFHAATMRVPNSVVVLALVNAGALHLLYQMGKLIGYALAQADHAASVSEDQDGSYSIDFGLDNLRKFTLDDATWMGRFTEAWTAYVAKGDVRFMQPWNDDARFDQAFVSPLVNGAEQFLVGHEMAHAILGHLDRPESSARIYGLEIESYSLSHQEELAADRLAWEALVKGADDEWEVFLPLGASLCLGVLAILEDLHNVVAFDTHPPAANRSAELLKWYEDQPRSKTVPKAPGTVFLPAPYLTVASDVLRSAWQRARPNVPRPRQ